APTRGQQAAPAVGGAGRQAARRLLDAVMGGRVLHRHGRRPARGAVDVGRPGRGHRRHGAGGVRVVRPAAAAAVFEHKRGGWREAIGLVGFVFANVVAVFVALWWALGKPKETPRPEYRDRGGMTEDGVPYVRGDQDAED